MSKEEINKVLDHFLDKALGELLSFLKELDEKNKGSFYSEGVLHQILAEDKELLYKLAQ